MGLAYFKKEDGKFYGQGLREQIEALKDGDYKIEITKQKKNRTNPMNSYLWGVVYPILADATGFTSEELHEIGKSEFLSEKIRMPADRRKKMKITKSTASLSVEEFQEYIEKLRQLGSQVLKVYIPLPNECPDPYLFDLCHGESS